MNTTRPKVTRSQNVVDLVKDPTTLNTTLSVVDLVKDPIRSLILCSIALATALFATPAQAQLNNGVPKEVEGVGVDQRLGSEIPLNVLVTDTTGRKQRLRDLVKGDLPIVFTLNYSDCPMLCSVQLTELTKTLDKLELKIGKDFQLITLSIDPKESTSRIRETKDKYVSQLRNQPGASTGWHFVTANQETITEVTQSLGFKYRYDKLTKEYYHAAMLAFISPEGVISRYSLDVAFPEDQMKLAIVEAGDGTVGSTVDQLLLLCFAYDENRNRYVASAWKIMRIGGFVTVGLLLATLTPFWFGRRRGLANNAELFEASQVAAGGDPAEQHDGRV